MTFDIFMEEFRRLTGLDGLAADANGVWRFKADDLTVGIREDAAADEVVIWGEIGAVTAENEETVCRVLLEAMSVGRPLPGTFSLETGGRICLQRRIPLAPLESRRIDELVGGFVTVLGEWHEAIKGFGSAFAEAERHERQEREALLHDTNGQFIRI